MGDAGGRIKVFFYSGYKGEETPRAIVVGGQECPIEEIISRKRLVDKNSGKMAEIYVCKVAGKTVKFARDEFGDCRLLSPRT